MCAGTWNVLHECPIVFIQQTRVAFERLAAQALGGNEASRLARWALSHWHSLMEKYEPRGRMVEAGQV